MNPFSKNRDPDAAPSDYGSLPRQDTSNGNSKNGGFLGKLKGKKDEQPKPDGDIHLRPNTGQTNDDSGGIGSLTEVAQKLRILTIVASTVATLWECFALPARILLWEYPAKTVLGAYLALFCLLLLGVELKAPLRDSFGILYHPLGRSLLLFLMSGMCFGILLTWWEIILGIAFVLLGGGYLYAYHNYPEYRRWQSYNDSTRSTTISWRDLRRATRSVSWADPNDPPLAWETVESEEKSSLLKK